MLKFKLSHRISIHLCHLRNIYQMQKQQQSTHHGKNRKSVFFIKMTKFLRFVYFLFKIVVPTPLQTNTKILSDDSTTGLSSPQKVCEKFVNFFVWTYRGQTLAASSGVGSSSGLSHLFRILSDCSDFAIFQHRCLVLLLGPLLVKHVLHCHEDRLWKVSRRCDSRPRTTPAVATGSGTSG